MEPWGFKMLKLGSSKPASGQCPAAPRLHTAVVIIQEHEKPQSRTDLEAAGCTYTHSLLGSLLVTCGNLTFVKAEPLANFPNKALKNALCKYVLIP